MRPFLLAIFAAAAFCLTGCESVRPAAAGRSVAAAEQGYFPGHDGAGLFYRRVGAGPEAIVYLHGGPASGFHGSGEFMEPLAAGRTLILYDQRSAGFSDLIVDPARLTFSDNVRDLEALRRHFGFERMTLVALSAGAHVATRYALDHPGRVQRMILVSPAPPATSFMTPRTEQLDRLLGEDRLRERNRLARLFETAPDAELRDVCRQLSDLIFFLYLAEPTPEKLRIAARRCDIPLATLRNRGRVRAEFMRSLGDYDHRPLLARLDMPVLVVEGAATNVPMEPTELWATLLPNARLVTVPGAGHEFFLDQPAAFVREAERFLRRSSRRSR